MNGLVGAKKGGYGVSQPKEKRENYLISRGLKQGAGRANLRKKEKRNGFVGAKKRGWANLRKTEKTNGLVWA